MKKEKLIKIMHTTITGIFIKLEIKDIIFQKFF